VKLSCHGKLAMEFTNPERTLSINTAGTEKKNALAVSYLVKCSADTNVKPVKASEKPQLSSGSLCPGGLTA